MNFLNRLKNFNRDDEGSSTLEFVIAFPFIFSMIAVTFDSGLLMAKYVVLENAVDRTVRDVRLSGTAGGSAGATSFKQEVCNIVTLIADCQNSLHVEMTPISTGSSFSPPPVTCVDRTVGSLPADSYTPGTPDDIVYLRACLVVDRYFPSLLSSVFTVDASGGILLIADTAYVVEPS